MPAYDELAHALKSVLQPTLVTFEPDADHADDAPVLTKQAVATGSVETTDVATSRLSLRKLFHLRSARRPVPVSEDTAISMPVVWDSQQTIFYDRVDSNRMWYLPTFEIVEPTGTFFTITDNGNNSQDKPMFKATVTLTYREVEPPEITTMRKRAQLQKQPFSLMKMACTLQSIGVIIRYGSADKPMESPAQAATLLPNNQLQIQLADDNDNAYASLFYRNLSDYKKDGLPASFVFSIAFRGWVSLTGNEPVATSLQKLPVASSSAMPEQSAISDEQMPPPKKRFFARVFSVFRKKNNESGVRAEGYQKLFTVNKSISKTIACTQTDGYVYQKTGGQPLPIGCNPPWSDEYTNGLFYRRYLLPEALKELPVSCHLFQQIAQSNVFLLVPKQYCISLDDDEFLEREPDEFAPDIVLTSLINPNPGHEAENTIRLDIILKPAISEVERQLLKQTILEDLGIVPQFKYPADLGISSVKDFEPSQAGVYELTPGTSGFRLTFQSSEGKFTQSLLNLAQVSNTDAVGLSLPVRYTIDQQNQQSSLLNVHLKKTVGQVLTIQLDDTKDELTITNRADDPVVVYSLLFYNEGQKGFAYCPMPAVLPIPARQEVVIPVQATFPQQANDIESFHSVLAHYEIQENDAQVQEIRLNMDLQSIRIPITVTTLDPVLHQITALKVYLQVDFMASLMQMPEPLVKTITPANGTFAGGDETPFVLTYPLSYGMDTSQVTAHHWMEISYANKPVQITGKFTQNLGANPRITITNDILKTDNPT